MRPYSKSVTVVACKKETTRSTASLASLDELDERDCHSDSEHVDSSRLFAKKATEHIFLASNNRVSLDVGGKQFHTTWATLTRNTRSMFSSMFSGRFPVEYQADGTVFIDRDPTHFQLLLNYLRDGHVCIDDITLTDKRALLQEAQYYQIQGLQKRLAQDIKKEKQQKRAELSNEKEYKLVEVKREDVKETIKDMTMLQGYEFENWLPADSNNANALVALLFSRKLSRGELMLLDRLQGFVGSGR